MTSTQRNKQKLRKSAKKQKKRVWMYRKGNVVICYKAPFVKVVHPLISGGSGESDKKTRLKTLLFTKLPAGLPEEDVAEFLRKTDPKDQDIWVEQYLKTASPDNAVTKEIAKEDPQVQSSGKTLNDAGKVLADWVKKKKFAVDTLQSIRKNAKYSPKELESIEKVLNSESVCDVPGSLKSVSSTMFNGITKGANVLGDFLAPPPNVDEKGNPVRRKNETTVQLMWFPRENLQYRKGNSTADPKERIKYGDFMVYIEPERYADITAYFSDVANSAEDLIKNALDGCTDSFCMKGTTHRKPYKHQVLQIDNSQPEIDEKKNTEAFAS
jgi:hypothetical protein